MPITPRGERKPDPELLRRLQARVAPDYTVEYELEGGGMSRVFVAQDNALHRRVVIKVLPPSLAATVSVERFRREIMLAAQLQHPHIVPVLTSGELDALPYFTMPFIDGESLRPRIQRGPLSVRETVGIMRDVARALSFAHKLGIVHRDIKPDNILLSGGSAIVTDFGVAKAILDSRNQMQIRAGATITAIGVSLGTPQYMAPEQAAADPTADHRADLYALGIVGYEMLAGVPPFHGRGAQDLLTAQLTEKPQPLAARRYDVPSVLSGLIMQCLEKDPANRPKNASDMVRVLESAEAVSGEFATPNVMARSRSQWGSIGGMIAVVLLAAGGLWFGTRKTAPAAAVAQATPALAIATLELSGKQPDDSAAARAVIVDLTAAMRGVERLKVTALRGSSPDVDPAVDTTGMVITGTLQRSGTKIRVNLRLAKANNDSTIWSGRFDGTSADMLALEDQIASAATAAVKLQIPPK